MTHEATRTCCNCGNPFSRRSASVKFREAKYEYLCCTRKCQGEYRSKVGRVSQPCGQCGEPVTRQRAIQKNSKSGHMFCNHHCAALYRNAHKTVGTRRSKLEVWLDARLRESYPNLTLLPNDKTAINSELDFYFPELKTTSPSTDPRSWRPSRTTTTGSSQPVPMLVSPSASSTRQV